MHKVARLATAVLFALTAACAQSEPQASASFDIKEVASGLDHPWGLAFLPDGRLLLTERAGRLRILGTDGKLSGPLQGVPAVQARGQGGLLDVALDPDFKTNRTIYLSLAEAGDGGASTAFVKATLAEGRVDNVTLLFRQQPKVSGAGHYGGRIVFTQDGKHIFLTTGDRQKLDPAQDLNSHLGKVIRLNRDGSVPQDNPFVGRTDAKPEIWSYGHRNIQGAAIEPATGKLWTIEFGPAGGDELNTPERGKNYGWPLVSWGSHYSGADIPDPPTRPDFADAVKYWNPTIAPSGMIFYTGATFPAWKGNILIAGLGTLGIVRLTVANGAIAGEERINLGRRIRDVEQAPDGTIYVATDDNDGRIWRLSPK
jgi:glucose/arabinose dehydrogenase